MLAFTLLALTGCGHFSATRPTEVNQTQKSINNRTPAAEVVKVSPGGEEVSTDQLKNQPTASHNSPGKTEPKEVSIKLWVTNNYGRHKIFQKEVPINVGETVLDLMQRNLQVETAYGGGFVTSINGIRSGFTETGSKKEKKDWFFYVNGVLMDRGVADYELKGGETVWCDYHDWGGSCFTPALVGAFPEPFVCGYDHSTQEVDLMLVGDRGDAADKLTRCLSQRGVKVRKVLKPEIISKRHNPTILVGLGTDLLSCNGVQDLFDHANRTGIFCQWKEGKLVALDSQGQKVTSYGSGCGSIVATGTGMGDVAPLWIIAGVDQEGLERAIALLDSKVNSLAGSFNIIVTPQRIVSLPVSN